MKLNLVLAVFFSIGVTVEASNPKDLSSLSAAELLERYRRNVSREDYNKLSECISTLNRLRDGEAVKSYINVDLKLAIIKAVQRHERLSCQKP